ncbi:hypothetical protein [Pseudomonas sp. KNUC1026]|uniref:hypothetical protein n=1 Tax=Pseudomonas sp. KNUC1026 TaxID=2893890 RepID=UPI001F3808E8|nr:hypothetical protein [Pseudomonas sp. KNUC1026]UFH51289.1 hypothetical protein LN139_09855 [Pseudomonas sp. KNUC1026]
MQSSKDLIRQPGYQALSEQQQRLVIASYTYRSLRLVEMFDRRYDQCLAGLFGRGLAAYAAGTAHDSRALKAEIGTHIPDTDEFGEEEGAYAQNAFIALAYLMEAATSGDLALLQASIEMTQNNADLLCYECDPDYTLVALLAAEQQVLDNLVAQAAAIASAEPATLDLIASLALPHRL